MASQTALADKAILLLVSGLPTAEVESALIEKAGTLTKDQVLQVVREAAVKITAASNVQKSEQFIASIAQLEALRSMAMENGAMGPALAARKELNKMLNLYSGAAAAAKGDGESSGPLDKLNLISSYILPLNLAASDMPVEEHARLAAQLIREHALNRRI